MLTFKELSDKYLAWCQINRSPRTYESNKHYISQFLLHPAVSEVLAIEVKPYQVQEWIDSRSKWSSSTKSSAVCTIKRVYSFAEQMGYVENSPIKKLKSPTAQRRDNPLGESDYIKILSHLKDGNPFRDLLLFVWGSGCRPQEVRHIELRHVSLEKECITFPATESKGKKHPRTIYIQGKALEIIRTRAAKYPDGKLFRNAKNEPWTKYAVCIQMRRLSKKIGKKFALYDVRHSFCQRLLEKDVNTVTVSELMGHRSTAMVVSVYSHMNKADHHLKSSLNKI